MSVFMICRVFGQEAEGTVITLQQALDMTMGQNASIEAVEHEEEGAEMQKKAAFGLRLPTVSLTGAYAYMSDDIDINLNSMKQPVSSVVGGFGSTLPSDVSGAVNNLLGRDWSLTLQEKDLAMIGANIQMPLFMGGKINAANRAAKIELEESKEVGNQTKNAIVSELVERYFGLSLAHQVVHVRRLVLEGMEEHLSDAVELEKNGMIARVQRLHAEMQVAEARKEYQKSVRDVQTINTALCNTLNNEGTYMPVTTMFVINDLASLDYFKSAALENNPLLKQAELKGKLAQEGVKVQKADFMPQVALIGGYDIYKYNMSDITPKWVVGAGVKIKIFDGLSREYKYSAAKSQVRQVNALVEKAGSDIETMVEKLYNELETNKEQIEAVGISLEFAKEYLRMQEMSFREGTASSTDVVDAQMNLAKIRTERLQAAYTYDLLLAQLLEVCGDSFSYPVYLSNREITPIYFE